jgi:hypothetical protein
MATALRLSHGAASLSDSLYTAIGLIIIADMALSAGLRSDSTICSPYLQILTVAGEWLRKAIRQPLGS